MTEPLASDKRTDLVKAHLEDELVNDAGQPVAPDDVAKVVDAAAARFEDAPIQEFTPLLIEHDARAALRDEGFHRELDDPDNDATGTDVTEMGS